jgi:hypothetical protein
VAPRAAGNQPTLGSNDRWRIDRPWREVVMADREKTGRIVGTVAAVGVVISVLAIIYMAMRPHGPTAQR